MSTTAIIEQLQRIVGPAYAVPFDDKRAAMQSAVFARLEPASAPSCVVLPNDVDQVQAIVRIAGAIGVGISVLPNTAANGMSLADLSGPSIVMDLSRMDEIYELDVDSGTTLLGPGVSFDQLDLYLKARAAPYWIDSDANGAHSVSGSVAERAFGCTPYGDHLLMQCGLELVTANGELLRTGMGALPGSDTWQLFKYNFGPYLDGLFSRSDLAIITKLGLWLMPAPPAYYPFMASLPTPAALEQAVEVLRPLKIGMVVPNPVTISHVSTDNALLAAAGPAAPAPPGAEWNLYGALYGSEKNVPLLWDIVGGALGGIDGASVYTATNPPAHPVWPLRVRMMRGEPVYRSIASSADRNLWFTAGAPMEGTAATEMLGIVDEFLSDKDVSVTRELSLSWRTLFMRVSIAAAGPLAAQRTAALELVERLSAAGYAITHDSPQLTASVSEHHVGAPLRALYGALGRALDPRSVLGKRGI